MKKLDSLKTFSQHVKVLAVVLFACLISLGANAQAYQYRLVTQSQTDWSGTYLLAYQTTTSTVILSGISTTTTTYGLTTNVTDYLDGDIMLSNATTDAHTVTITPVTDNTYTLYLKDVGYLGWLSGNSLTNATTVPSTNSDKYYWTITMTDGVLTIANVNTPNRKLQYNTSSPRFATYTSNQKACSFFKRENFTGIPAPVFSLNPGAYYSAPQTVTITCDTTDAIIYYTLDGSKPTTSSAVYSTPITIDSNITLKAIAVKGTNKSVVATAGYTFPFFRVLDNIAAFKAQTSTDTIFKVNSPMTVIFQTADKYHTFLQDSSAAIYVYSTMDKAYQAGDVINGGVFGTYSLYYTMNEMKPVAGAPLADGVAGTPVAPIEVTVSELYRNYDLYEGKLVTVKGVNINTNFTFTTSSNNGVDATGDTIFNIRNTFKTLSMSVVANDVADVTGLVTRYDNKIQIAPRNNQDIVIPVATLPYTVDFDQNVDESLNINNGTATNKWFVGTAEGFDNNKLYISSSNGVTNKYDCSSAAQVTASRELIIPENGATLSFDVRVNGEANNDMLWVVLYNYTNDIINNTADWSVGIYDEPEWTNVKAVISPEHAGKARLVFYWVNNNNGIGEQYPAAIDNISITEATCAQPTELAVTVSTDTAVVTWNTVDSTQNAWTLEYKLEDHSEWYTVNADTTNVTLTGLQGNSNYNVRVKANCGSEWTYGSFQVECLTEEIIGVDTTITIGTGESTQSNMIPGYYGYHYFAAVYEMENEGMVDNIAFNVSSVSTTTGATMKMWVKAVDGHYEMSSSNTFSSMLEGATLIFDGPRNITSTGWKSFPINNGGLEMTEGQSLLVLVSGTGCTTNGGCSESVYYTSAPNMTWCKLQDGTDPGQGTTGSTYTSYTSYRPDIKIHVSPKISCDDQIACAAPDSLTVTDITTDAATIAWTGDADNYSFEYKTGDAEWTAINVSDNTYTLTGLTQKTTYTVRVKALCGENNNSLYSDEVEFATTSVCPVVTNIEVSNLSTTSTVTWTPGGNENEWKLRFRPMNTNGNWVELHISGIASTTFGGLNEQTDYEVEIMALCDPEDEDNQSSWAHYEFKSGCAPFELPYVEGFNTTTRPDCWDDEGITFNGTAAVADSAAQWLMTPPIQIPAEYSTYIVVDMQGTASLMASYRGTAMNRFENVAVLANNEDGHYIIEVPADYKDKAVNFMFLATDEFSIDNVEFTQCAFVPANLTAANPLNNSVELSWNGVNNNGWVLEYAKSNSDDWTTVNLEQTSDTVTYTLAGLEGETSYKFRVSTICAGGFISNPSAEATITTRCNAVSVPYAHFSTNYDADLNCWDKDYSGTNTQSEVIKKGYHDLAMHNYYNRSLDTVAGVFGNLYAVLPAFDTTLKALQISFSTERWYGKNKFKVDLGVVTNVNDPKGTFEFLESFDVTDTRTSYTKMLNGVQTVGNLAFRLSKDTVDQEVRISDVLVEVIPPCQKPSNLTATPISEDTMLLKWDAVGLQDLWEIKYNENYDFNPETAGTLKYASNREYKLGGLTYGTTYVFYIRTNCGDTAWSRGWVGPVSQKLEMKYNLANNRDVTACHGTVIFEKDTASTATNTMTIHPNDNTQWITLTNGTVTLNGATLTVYQGTTATADNVLATYTGTKTISFTEPICANELTLKLTNIGTTDPVVNINFECANVPTCSAPSKPVFNEVSQILTWEAGCWGAQDSFKIMVIDSAYYQTILTYTTTTNTIAIPVVELTNNHKYFFQVQSICGDVFGEMSELSNSFEKVACANPKNLTATPTTSNETITVTLTWEGSANNGFEVGYKMHDAYTWNTSIVQTNTFTTLALDENQNYDFRVKAICSSDEQSEYVTISITTDCIHATTYPESDVVLGEGTTTNTYLPAYTLYNNTLSEQIYTAAEIGNAGPIQSIAFYNGGTTKSPNLKIYMVNTNKASFANTTDWLTVNNGDLVYEGDVTFTASEWTTITFDTPFFFDGTSNVGLIVDEHMQWSGGLACRVYESTDNCSMYAYNDNVDYNAVGASYTASSRLSVKNQVQFHIGGTICAPVVSCPAPSNIAVASVSEESATINWNRGGSETSWTVVYKLNNGEDTTVMANDTFYTITGLEGSTAYTLGVTVYANCNLQSEGTSNNFSFTTQCPSITTFPWTEDFEAYATGTFNVPCWENERIVDGTGSGSLSSFSIYSINQSGNATHKLQLPDMKKGTMTILMLPAMNLPNSNYQFILDVLRNSTSSSHASEGIRVFVSTDGEIDGATELAFISRYCSVNDNHYIPAESASGWYTYELPIGISGPCYIILRGESQYGNATYMDNFVVSEIPTCSAPQNLAFNGNGITNVLSWMSGNYGTPQSYTVQYRVAGSEDAYTTISTTTDTTAIALTDLELSTTYEAQVRANCDATDFSEWSEPLTFTTVSCLGGSNVVIGTGTSNSYIFPAYTYYYNYSGSSTTSYDNAYTQQIYLANEIGAEGDINAMTFKVASGSCMANVDVYLMHTNASSLSSGFLPIDGAVKVFSGNVNFASGDATIHFDTPFSYNGTSNLALIVDRNGPIEYESSSYSNYVYFYYTSKSGRARYSYTTSNIDPSTVSATSGYSSSYLNNISFEVCPPPCAMPSAPYNYADNTLSWSGNANSYNLQYAVYGTEEYVSVNNITDTFYTFPDLLPNTTYSVLVQANCGESGMSNWVSLRFTTPCQVYDMPYVEDFESVPDCWTAYDRDGDDEWWYIGNGAQFAHLGNGFAFSESDGLTPDNWLVSPAVYISDTLAELSYWISNNSERYPEAYSVYISTVNNLDSFLINPLVNCDTLSGDSYIIKEFSLKPYYGKSIYVAFRHHNSDDNTYLLLDDVSIMVPPSCYAPTELTVSDVKADSANVSWFDRKNQGNYAVEYMAEGNTVWTTIMVTDTMAVTLTGLTHPTSYTVRVKAICGEGDESEYTEEVTFSTPITCFTPTELAVSNVTDSSAIVTWTDNKDQGNYAVEYKAEGEEAWTTVAGDTNLTVKLTNLNYLTTYSVRIKTVCGEGDESAYSDEVEFTTLCVGYSIVGGEGTIEITYNSTSTSSYIPAYGNYNYSYTQQIYKAAEMDVPNGCTINSISFDVSAGGSRARDIDIYLMHTTANTISSWLPLNNPVKVYSGVVSFSSTGWKNIEFTTPFEYNGIDNLLLIVDDNTGGWNNFPTFRIHNTDEQGTIYNYDDNANYDIYNPSLVEAGIPSTIRNNVIFGVNTRTLTCPPDNDLAVDSIAPIEDNCDLSNAKVTIRVKNTSFLNAVNGFTATLALNDTADVVTETVNATIAPQGSYTYTFAHVPAYTDGSNNIMVTVTAADDEVADNNVITLNDIRQVVPATVPYDQTFSNVDLTRDAWKQGKENNNPNLWKINGGVLTFMDNDTIDAQNYVITHCIDIPAGQMQVSYDYNALSNLPENLNVYMGTTPDISTMTLIGSHEGFTKADEDYTFNYLFNNENEGVYYFAIEALSTKGNMGVTFDNLAIMPMVDVLVKIRPDNSGNDNGVVDPIGTVKVPYKGSLTINLIPDEMYHVAGVWVDSVRVMNEDPYNASFMMYTLDNITETHTIEVQFKMEFHIFKYAYNYNSTYEEVGGHYVGAPIDTTLIPSGRPVNFVADEHYTLHSLVVGLTPPASEGAIIEGDNVIDAVTYDEATRTYTYVIDTLYRPNYYVQGCFKRDTVAINYATLTGEGVYDGVNTHAGETHITYVDYGTDFTSSILPAEGYYTMNVTVNGVDTGIIDHYDFDSVITEQYVTAQFGHKVTASIMNINNNEYLGSDEVRGSIEPAEQMILSGSSCSVYGYVQEHFHLSNFFVNGVDKLADVTFDGLNFSYTIDSLVANTDIVAVVRIDTIAIYYTVDGGNGYVNGNLMEAPAIDTLYLDYGSSFMSNFAAATGYHIVNVTVNGTAYNEIPQWLTEYLTEAQYITVTFALNEYDITTTAHGNGSVSEGMHVVFDPESSYTFTATPAVGSHISQILRNNEALEISDPETTYTETIAPVLSDYNYVAFFAANVYTVTASCGENGTIDPYGAQSFEYGETPTFTVTPNAGYAIEHVYVDGEEVELTNNTYTFEALTANHTISATFTADNYTITATAGNHGSIDPDGENVVMAGSTVVYTITPATGYEIEDVTVDGQSVGAVSTYTFENVEADHTIAATFSALQFTITATAGANGTITPAGVQTVNYGSTPTFTVAANPGYEIDYVLVDGQNVALTSGAYTFAAVTANHEIYAAFKMKTYTITVTDPANGTITPNGIITVNHGATPTFTVTPATGYNVTAITVNGTNVIASAQATVMGAYTYTFPAVTANRTLTATMTKKQFTITATAGAHGTITGPATVNYGDNATYTIAASEGYEIEDVTVDGMHVGAVATYTFHNVTANHTIVATFKVEPCVVPTNLRTINIDSTSATLVWYHPGADSYDIQYKVSTANTWTLVSNVPGFAYNLTNLQSATNYVWKIKANTVGCTDSDWSNANSFTTLAGPSSPDGINDYVKNHVNVYAEHNRVHIINDYNVDINNVAIYDMYGKLIYSGNAISNPEVIELNVAVGTYVVRLNTQQGPAVYKVHINR